MKDIAAYLEKLRAQTAECELIRDLATDRSKREVFAKLALHFKTLADELEQAMKAPTEINSIPEIPPPEAQPQ